MKRTQSFGLCLLIAACSRSETARTSAPAAVSATVRPPATSVIAAVTPTAPSSTPTLETAAPPLAAYPVGKECMAASALVEEKRTLSAPATWPLVSSKSQRLKVRAPAGLFQVRDSAKGLVLESKLRAGGLGPQGKGEHVFAIHIRRAARSLASFVSDPDKGAGGEPLLAGVYFGEAFPTGDENVFVPNVDSNLMVGPGFAARLTVAARPAFVVLNGVEGYNSDFVLVRLGEKETLLVLANWNSGFAEGQPGCFQRRVIAGVVESLTLD